MLSRSVAASGRVRLGNDTRTTTVFRQASVTAAIVGARRSSVVPCRGAISARARRAGHWPARAARRVGKALPKRGAGSSSEAAGPARHRRQWSAGCALAPTPAPREGSPERGSRQAGPSEQLPRDVGMALTSLRHLDRFTVEPGRDWEHEHLLAVHDEIEAGQRGASSRPAPRRQRRALAVRPSSGW